MAPEVTVSSLWATDADLQSQVDEQHRKRAKASGWRLFVLAFSTLGVVYGDIGTSPLYVFASIFPDGAPEDSNVTLGAASSIVWSITAIVLIKYVVFTLQANDNGEGGIFALYAIICRAVGIQNGSLVHEADLSLSQYQRGTSTATDWAASSPPSGGPSPHQSSTQPPSPTDAGKGMRAAWSRRRVSAANRIRGTLSRSAVGQTILLAVVLLGANMIISDGVLTPAISVVSAIEGIQFQTGISRGAVVGIAIGILVALFAVQPWGTQRVAMLFSPAVLTWFLVNATIGFYNLSIYGWGAFRAISPHYMYYFWSGRAAEAWRGLGAVLLCVTGAEALYADMGHFSAAAIRYSFIGCVYPSLIITYLGQTAMILSKPETSSAAYWESIPSPVLWPVVVVATAAAIIASQALISGSFTIVQQAISMNAFPRLTVRHTSPHIMGQVYVSEVNWLLMTACVAVVAGFQTSAKIGNAYGLAVVTVMLIDTTLLAAVMILAWDWSVLAAASFWAPFTFIVGAFFSSTLEKVPTGAWFSLMLAAFLASITFLWHWGQTLKLQYVRKNRILLRDLFQADGSAAPLLPAGGAAAGMHAAGDKGTSVARASMTSTTTSTSKSGPASTKSQGTPPLTLVASGMPVSRVPGLGVYYTELLIGVPPVLERCISLLPAIHSVVVLLTVRFVPVPRVMPSERLLIRRLRFPGFYHVVARYGYMERPDHGSAFVQEMVQEIFEYLQPLDFMTVESQQTPIGLTLPDGPEPPPGQGAAAANTAAPGAAGEADLELGLLAGRSQQGVQRVSLSAGEVRVDASESLSAVAGRSLAQELSLQLVQLQAGSPGSPQPGAAPGRARSVRHSSLTMAVALPEGTSSAAEEGPAAAPWVQMPSVVRRVRAQMLGQPPPPSAAQAIALWRRQQAGLSGEEPGTMSLPLPDRQARPHLALAVSATSRDATASLPLPAARPRPALPLGTAARAQEAGQAQAAGRERSTTTFRRSAASRLGQDLWQHLQSQNYLGQPAREADAAATLTIGAAAPAAVSAGEASAADSSPGRERRTTSSEAEARRLLFNVYASSAAGSRLGDMHVAEREALLRAYSQGVTYLVGRSALLAVPDASWLKRQLLEGLYGAIAAVCRPSTAAFGVPRTNLLHLGVDYSV